jgi:hypothetical protein
MDYKLKYLKYKNKYLALKAGSLNVNITDPNLMKYNIIFENYEIVIYGEHHYDHDYSDFIQELKKFLRNHNDKKYVIVLEISDEDLENIETFTSKDSQRSISYSLAKSYKNEEFKEFSNITFICGDNRTEEFNKMLDRLEDNVINFSDIYIEYELPDDADENLLDLWSIEKYWEDEKKRFIGSEYDTYKNKIDNLINNVKNNPIQFKYLGKFIYELWFYWIRISNIWALNRIKDYMNGNYNIIFITGEAHLFDYVYLINQKYKSDLHFMCNNYKVTDTDLNYIFNNLEFFEDLTLWYEDKCRIIPEYYKLLDLQKIQDYKIGDFVQYKKIEK